LQLCHIFLFFPSSFPISFSTPPLPDHQTVTL
jgi:hypothetical protein